MGLFEKFLNRSEGERISARGLHKSFGLSCDGFWYFKREFSIIDDHDAAIKVQFTFDDPSLLDESPFLTKIGPNQDETLEGRWIGFAYGRGDAKQKLIEWAKKFPHAELIDHLNREGVSTPESTVTQITGSETERSVAPPQG